MIKDWSGRRGQIKNNNNSNNNNNINVNNNNNINNIIINKEISLENGKKNKTLVQSVSSSLV